MFTDLHMTFVVYKDGYGKKLLITLILPKLLVFEK